MAASRTYDALNKCWKSASKVILGGEVGELNECADWLWRYMEPMHVQKSRASGKDVYVAISQYSGLSRFISLDEVEFGKKFQPLNINEVKDIDSVVHALSERFYYCGNVLLSNSRDVEKSANINNSLHVLHSNFIYDSEYVAYSSYSRNAKYLFGVNNDVFSSFLIKGYDTHKDQRCLEVWRTYRSSDCHYCGCVEDVQNAMFSFGIKRKQNVIGNLELSRDKFQKTRAKLLEDLRAGLKARKCLPSLMDLVSRGERMPELPKGFGIRESQSAEDMKPIEEAFSTATKVIFGKELRGIDDYGKWLTRYIPCVKEVHSAASGKTVYWGQAPPWKYLAPDRLVSEAESRKLGELLKLEPRDLESLESVKAALWKIAFLTPETRLGENLNYIRAALVNESVHCYNGPVFSCNEYCAFSFWPRNSKYMFGCAVTFSSSFCINTNYSLNITRSFEVDSSSNSSDLYFSHNCENVHDSMFCFNAKNLRNCIGNAQLAPEKYKKVKEGLLEQISSELERKKALKWDIYNLGAAHVMNR